MDKLHPVMWLYKISKRYYLKKDVIPHVVLLNAMEIHKKQLLEFWVGGQESTESNKPNFEQFYARYYGSEEI